MKGCIYESSLQVNWFKCCVYILRKSTLFWGGEGGCYTNGLKRAPNVPRLLAEIVDGLASDWKYLLSTPDLFVRVRGPWHQWAQGPQNRQCGPGQPIKWYEMNKTIKMGMIANLLELFHGPISACKSELDLPFCDAVTKTQTSHHCSSSKRTRTFYFRAVFNKVLWNKWIFKQFYCNLLVLQNFTEACLQHAKDCFRFFVQSWNFIALSSAFYIKWMIFETSLYVVQLSVNGSFHSFSAKMRLLFCLSTAFIPETRSSCCCCSSTKANMASKPGLQTVPRLNQIQYYLQGTVKSADLFSLVQRLKGLCERAAETDCTFQDHEMIYVLS